MTWGDRSSDVRGSRVLDGPVAAGPCALPGAVACRGGPTGPRAVIVAVAVAAVGAAATAARDTWQVDEARFRAHVRFLASDRLEGRGNGTAGLELAAAYIARAFEEAGLEPGGADGTWFQPFTLEVRQEPLSDDALVFHAGGRDIAFGLGREYHPLSIVDRTARQSRDEIADAPIVFAGYGISAPDLDYDDYAGLDVAGRAVIVFTHEPQEDDEASIFDGRALTRHGTLGAKARAAAARGARLLIVVDDPAHAAERPITPNWRRHPDIDELPLPVVRASRQWMDTLVPIAFDEAARAIDLTLTPRSQPVDGLRVSYAARYARVRAVVRNVVGLLRGRHPDIGHEAVVIGGHYDHLGRSGLHSRAVAADGQIHNGADDNASGIAALLEAARAAALARDQFGRTLVFAAFAGEELGLLGSQHYVDHPAVPIADTLAMINLDMVGRASGRVLVGGLELSPVFQHAIDSLRPLTALTIRDFREGGGYADGASDNWSFIRRGVPALAFFTGFHADYHRPSDDWDRVDVAGAVEITRLALEVAARLASPAVR